MKVKLTTVVRKGSTNSRWNAINLADNTQVSVLVKNADNHKENDEIDIDVSAPSKASAPKADKAPAESTPAEPAADIANMDVVL